MNSVEHNPMHSLIYELSASREVSEATLTFLISRVKEQEKVAYISSILARFSSFCITERESQML